MAAGGLALSFSPSLSISVIHPPPSLQLILTSRWNVDHSGKYAPTSSSEFVISLITGWHLSIDTMSGGMGLLYLWGLEVWRGNHRPVHLLLPENRVWLGVCVRVRETERVQTCLCVSMSYVTLCHVFPGQPIWSSPRVKKKLFEEIFIPQLLNHPSPKPEKLSFHTAISPWQSVVKLRKQGGNPEILALSWAPLSEIIATVVFLPIPMTLIRRWGC